MPKLARTLITGDPFEIDYSLYAYQRGRLPGFWVSHPQLGDLPNFVAYKLDLNLDRDLEAMIHVTADERYHFYVDGEWLGLGSERGDLNNWFFESYSLRLEKGEHTLVALVFNLGTDTPEGGKGTAGAPVAQMSIRHGFLLLHQPAEGEPNLSTGKADWQCQHVKGIELVDRQPLFGAGDKQRFVGSVYDHRFTSGHGDWVSVKLSEEPIRWDANDVIASHYLRPAALPPMMLERWNHFNVRHVSAPPAGPTAPHLILSKDDIVEEHRLWTDLLVSGTATIPPRTRRRIIVDFETYVCAYTSLATQGGAGSRVRLHWQESLYDDPKTGKKGNRDTVEGKFFTSVWWHRDGVGDEFLVGGRDQEQFITLWWSCGRYMELLIETHDEPLTIERLDLLETRYPLNPTQAPFTSNDATLNRISEISLRTLQMCSHETFFDCPYFEQLQYIGDTRIQALITMAISGDDRLVRKALQMFNWSRMTVSGFTQSRYPSHSRQIIPPFSLWWVCMVEDYALWRGDKEFIKSLLPGCRSVLDGFAMGQDLDPASLTYGLIRSPEGWNFVDWVKQWRDGVPPGGDPGGYSTAITLQFVLAYEAFSKLNEWVTGTPAEGTPLSLALNGLEKMFDAETGLMDEAPGVKSVSQHPNCLAVLVRTCSEAWRAKALRAMRAAVGRPDLLQTTVYFRHYWYEALYEIGDAPTFLADLDPWWTDQVRDGLTTCIESPDPRSDCHAWAGHPLYHSLTQVFGVRPREYGGASFDISPIKTDLEASGKVITPLGAIELKLAGGELSYNAPKGISLSVRGNRVTGSGTFRI